MRRPMRPPAFLAVTATAFGLGLAAWLGLPWDPRGAEPARPLPPVEGARGPVVLRGTTASSEGGSDAGEALPLGVRQPPLDPRLAGRGRLVLRVVDARTGADAAGAEVVLHGTGHGSEAVHFTTRTMSDGRAALEGVPAGPWYVLGVQASGLPRVCRADVDVVRGQTTDLGVIHVGVARTWRVTVWDAASWPVAGARVEALVIPPEIEGLSDPLPTGYDWPSLDRGVAHSALTDSEGMAEFAAVRPGRYLLRATREGAAPARWVGTVDPVGGSRDPILILRPARWLEGRVVDTEDRPVAGAQVVDADRASLRDLPRWTTTDAEGRFALAFADDPPARLFVTARGHVHTAFSIASLPPARLLLRLPVAALLRLRVTDARDGTAVGGARVECVVLATAAPEGPQSPAGPPEDWCWQGATDARGHLDLMLPAGVLKELSVQKGWFCIARFPVPEADQAGGACYQALDVPAQVLARTTLDLDVGLTMRPATTVRGIVRGVNGRPMPGIPIHTACYGNWPPKVEAVSDASGAFCLEDVAIDWSTTSPSELWVRAWAPGWVVARPWAPVTYPGGVPTVSLTLIPSAAVRGRVVDANGRGVAGAHVSWSGQDHGVGIRWALTDEQGRFVIPDLEPKAIRAWRDGPGEVVARREGYRPARSAAFSLVPGQTTDVGTLALAAGATLQGAVLDAEGRPAAGVRVTGCPALYIDPPGPDPEDLFHAVTDGEGRFRWTGMDPARCCVTALPRHDGEVGMSREVVMGRDTDGAEVLLRLERTAWVVGRVLSPDGAAVPDARVTADPDPCDTEGGWHAHTESGPQGEFRLACRASPRVLVRVYSRAEGSTQTWVAVPRDARLDLVLSTAPGDLGDGFTLFDLLPPLEDPFADLPAESVR